MVAAQTEVGVKTNEVPIAAVVLGQIDLNNKIVTADALHTVKATANPDAGSARVTRATLARVSNPRAAAHCFTDMRR